MLSHQYQQQQQTLHYLQPQSQPPAHTTMSEDFRNFSSLPPEIRTMVWEYALPEPRVYEVMDVPHAKQKMNAADGLMFANVHHEPPPALAAVCRESRYFVLRHYRPLTLGRTTKYVDLARDLLLLEPYLLLKRLHRTLHFMSRIPLIRDHMSGLALGTSYGVYTGICHPVLSWKVAKSNMGKLLTGLAKFPKLKSLLFVVHQEFQFEFDFRYPPNLPVTPRGAILPPRPPPLSQVSSPGSDVPPPPAIYSTPNFPTSMMGLQRPLPPPPPYASPSPRSDARSVASSTPSPLPSPVAAHHPLAAQRPPSSLPQQLPLPPVPAARPPPPPLPPSAGSLPAPQYPPVIHQAQAFPAPQPAAPQSVRPQVVHQAYRFKFDIEGNINRHPRRPHLNELLFYPLENSKGDDDKDDWEALLNSNAAGGGSGGGLDGGEDEEDGEWCDPWPTNDDWRRFRRRFQRAVVATLQSGLAGDGQNAFCVDDAAAPSPSSSEDKKYQQFLQQQQQQKCNGNSHGYGYGYGSGTGYNGPHHYNSLYSLHGNSGGSSSSSGAAGGHGGDGGGHRRRYSLKHNLPAIKGASLLWRYTRGE